MEVDEESDQKSDIYRHMAVHARLKNEFAEDKKCHNLNMLLKSEISLSILEPHLVNFVLHFFTISPTLLYNVTKCIDYNTNCMSAVTKSNQIGINTARIVTNTFVVK